MIIKIAILSCLFSLMACTSNSSPNIIFILADDLGWNDIGFHGSSQIPTPNLDALALSGVSLHRYYVNPICTPSRSALMTGKYPIHTGMQHGVIFGMEPWGLPLTEKILPQYLKDLSYQNHIVGKWHLGSYKKEYTPLFRGFDSHLGYWTGHQDYFDHTAVETGTWGYDMRRNLSVAFDLHGKYTTDVISDESVRIINNHNTDQPLFLYVAHAAVHSGNPYEPLRAPDQRIQELEGIEDYQRRKFAAMLSKMDDSVGHLMKALKNKKMLDNTIIVFSTDNGGPAEGFNLNAASNWPLRGVKNTVWEGGIRGAGFVWSPKLNSPRRTCHQAIHISDWLPTLYAVAGGDLSNLGKIDGINVWDSISSEETSKRNSTLHNIDEIYGRSSMTIGKWKVLNGTTYGGAFDSWYGPSGNRDPNSYSYIDLQGSDAGTILFELGHLPSPQEVSDLREENSINCYLKINVTSICKPLKGPCLYDIESDPCELNNVAEDHPEILTMLMDELGKLQRTAVPPNNKPIDPKGDPKNWNNVFTNFGDADVKKL